MAMSASIPRQGPRPGQALFPVTVFASAALVFLVEPMVAKLVLPLLGGSPSVWNTSMAFFQLALLPRHLPSRRLSLAPETDRQPCTTTL